MFTRPGNLPTAYPCLLYYLKCYDQNGTLVRDFIPVRVGQIGYLYDKVSGKLFGNAGTGNFVCGPDIVPIEYLESTGTQYVDTGVIPGNGTSYDIRFRRTRTNATESIFGLSYKQSVAVMQRILGMSTKIEIARGGSNQAHIVNITNDTDWHSVQSSSSAIVVDGISTSRDFSANAAPYSFYVFAQQAAAGTANAFAKAVVNYLKIYESGVLIRDFIPVRIGTVGYLYDKVSNKLYGNSGTGSFVLGPDKL